MPAATEFPIIVIGASVGGVKALRELAGGLPAGLTAALFMVLHVGDNRSDLPALLARAGKLPAAHATDRQVIEPGHIYVAPPRYHLLLEPGHTILSRGPRENWSRPAIDALFRTAAKAYGGRVIGIVLTGRLNDGTAGLKAVRNAGGIAIVQQPEDAECPDMPASALYHAGADFCLPLREIPKLLVELTSRYLAAPETEPRVVPRRTIP